VFFLSCKLCFGLYELRPIRLRTRLLAAFLPDRAHGVLTFVAAILIIGPGGWVGFGGFVYLALALWRGVRVNLRADASGITVTNLLRRRKTEWSQVSAIRSPQETQLEPLTLQIDVRGSGLRRLWSGTSVYATLGIGKKRRREIALELAALGRTYGQGFPAGTEDEIAEQFKAGLFDNRDPETHRAWRAAHS
jgi:hypothetical protein